MTPSRVKLAPRRPILLLWGVLTALFVVCAYAMALGIAVLCGVISVGVLSNFSGGSLLVSVGAGTCAVAIFWSLLPRRDRFDPPGPALDPATQPRLFSEISQIAAAFEEPMPNAVYLMLDPNAWVARRGGLLGFGSRRVMALGLPLVSVLTVSEFRAVLAHEFAHYYGGDTGLGPWIQRARETLARSLNSLSGQSAIVNVLSRWAVIAILRLVIVLVFTTYWKVFLWLTLLVSRQWEYRADELACAAAGAQPLIDGLRKIETATCAWPSFWRLEAEPALQAGFGPPLADGFGRYLQVPPVAGQLAAFVGPRLEQEKPNASDTHPTFRQRVRRAESYRFDNLPQNDAGALTLFDQTRLLEQSAVQSAVKDGSLPPLRPIDWEQVGPVIMIPRWSAFVSECRDLLVPYSVADIPAAVSQLSQIATRIRDPKGRLFTREQRLERAAALLWMALSLALLGDGWDLQSQPGQCFLVRGGAKIVPYDLITKLRAGQMTAEEYRRLIAEIAAGDLRLAPVQSATA